MSETYSFYRKCRTCDNWEHHKILKGTTPIKYFEKNSTCPNCECNIEGDNS